MYLTEYLGLRGVGAAALTVPEATLLGIDNTVSGWVGRNARVEIPAELAVLAAKKPGKDALKSMASALLAKAGRPELTHSGADEPPTLDKLHRHEAIDRCDLFARMTEDNLLSHPAVQANAEARVLIEVAITSLAEAYQALCQNQGY